MNNKRYIALIWATISSSFCALASDIQALQHAKKLFVHRTFSTASRNTKNPTLRIPQFINTKKKFGPLDSKIGVITYAPNHPLTETSRKMVFSATSDGVVQHTHNVITVADPKNGYARAFKSITLRDGKCTKDDCLQETIGILSDINTLKVPSKNIDAEAKKLEAEYGKLTPQKFEPVTVDAAKQCAAVISACMSCQRIELIFDDSQTK